MSSNNKDKDKLENHFAEEELVDRFTKLFGHKPSSNQAPIKNITKTNNLIIDLTNNGSLSINSNDSLINTNNSQYKLPKGKDLDYEEIEKFLMSESLDTSILIDYDNQKSLDKVVTKFLNEDFKTSSNKNFDEYDDATNLIKELQDDINLESKYKENLHELKEKKEQDFNELENRYNQLKEFKIHGKNKNSKNNLGNLGPPPEPIDLSEFGLNDDDPNTWCCICNEDAIIKCKDCDGDLYCQPCFNEGHFGLHSDYDMKRHKFEKYKRPVI
ncbi:hypothetical protein C1645_816892 [Glomus cerebriforme]|uniref:Uncharacterized protein n=1 Tax=Glomus cerebriforme TaxID=658196 RepID=A0A397TFY5_9GLOM|nr:hypothetical protein C1645_816892 [Glomus cerebriforme]